MTSAVRIFVMALMAPLLAAGAAAGAGDGMSEGVKTVLDKITWLGHASFRIQGEAVIYIDPWKIKGGPKADIILITHEHHDHCSPQDVAKVSTADTVVVTVAACAASIKGTVKVIAPGQTITVKGVKIEAVPAYNVNKSFHPKGSGWAGYLVETGGMRIYHAGDTDFIPEMKTIRADIALLPVGGTYTMTASEAAQAARAINPKAAVPMHFGDIVGSQADAEAFRRDAGVPVEIKKPQP